MKPYKGALAGIITTFLLAAAVLGAHFSGVLYESGALEPLRALGSRQKAEAAEILAAAAPPSALPGGIVSLTFDDGYQSAFLHGVPELEARHMTATFYVISSYFLASYMTKDELLELSEHGFEVAAHSRTHPPLASLPVERARDEIFGSRDDLRADGLPVSSFAYPYGSFNAGAESAVREAGFSTGRSIQVFVNASTTDRFALGGLSVYAATPLEKVKAYIDEAKMSGNWAILIFHRIDEAGNPISISHKMLGNVLDYVALSGMPVMTVRDAALKFLKK